MFTDIQIRTAQIIGRMHLTEGLNMQDVLHMSFADVGPKSAVHGVICDGCSRDANQRPLHSEVGARLGGDFLRDETQRLLLRGVPIRNIPPILHRGLINYVRRQADTMPFRDAKSQIQFIVDKFLFTTVGFIRNQTETLVYYQGDGVIVINDERTIIDQNDHPTYIGYHAIRREWLPKEVSKLPEGFTTLVFPNDTLEKMAIASDSLGKEPDFFDQLWGYKNPMGLQRKVNAWSLNDHKFADDLSIITVEKVAQ